MNRRTAVGVLGGLVFGTVAAVRGRRALAQAVCTLTPEQIEGPFYLDQARIRDAISEGKPGVPLQLMLRVLEASASTRRDRKSTRLNSSHANISYAVFCLKKKKKIKKSIKKNTT